jgi:signal transduction histidine kinase
MSLSAYLHGLITRSLIEDDRYNSGVAQTVEIAERIAALDLFKSPDDLSRDVLLVADARPEFKQIDVYERTPAGLRLAATNAPGATRLALIDERTPDNDLGEMEHPLPDVVTMEIVRDGARYWLISMAIGGRRGYVTSMVLKNPYSPLVSQLQVQHDLVLGGAILVCVALCYVMFAHFFRRPARDIGQAMTLARGGNLQSRAAVRRHDELGEIARGFNLMMDDLSARDREREDLLTKIRGFNDALRAEVDAATGGLRAANEALFQTQQRLVRSERLAAMGQVAASLAHEIGTPLNSISGHLQLLARGRPHDADAQRRVAIINTQLDFIVGIVGSLLKRTHKRRGPLRPTDLNALVGEVLRLVGPTLDAHAIRVSTALDPDLRAVLAEHDSLHQVFLNLINNAIDAMPAGGLLTIATRLDADARAAEVSFHDTGTGVASEAMDHLFEPLWTTKETGSGFGLAIAREIMIEHGGAIDVTSGPSGGAIFRLRLPFADVAVA